MTPSASAEIGPQQAGGLLDGLSEIGARAAAAIMATPFSEIARRSKSDQSPVTAADVEAERIIVEGLGRLLPGLAVIAEESVARAPAELGASYAIVDPLDGTKEFLAGRDEFTVNLAIVTGGVAVAGTVAAPERLTAATSRSHLDARTEEFLARLPLAARYACGSSIKFCQLAQGDADLYPRLSPVCEWDIAAGCAILAAAGGVASDPQ